MLLSPLRLSPYAAKSLGTSFPIANSSPTITGTLEVGGVLTVAHGTYIGEEPIIITGIWQRDSVDIVGETNDTYTLLIGDENKTIRYRETATDVNNQSTITYSNEYKLFGIGYMKITTTFIIQ